MFFVVKLTSNERGGDFGKKIGITVLILGVIIGGLYFFVKFNPPLELGTLGSSGDNKSVVIGVGNKGISEITILDVLVNDNENPTKTKVQVSNALQGFIITDNFNSSESKKYGFRNLEDTTIKVEKYLFDKLKNSDDNMTANKDEVYGVSVLYTEEIFKVHIKYSYFGITFRETIQLINSFD